MRKQDHTLAVRFVASALTAYCIYRIVRALIIAPWLSKTPLQGFLPAPFSSHLFNQDLLRRPSVFFRSEAGTAILSRISLFFPLGFVLPFVHPKTRKFWQVLCLTGAFALLLEIAQYFTKTGICATDDGMIYIAGAGLGFLTYSILKAAYRYA